MLEFKRKFDVDENPHVPNAAAGKAWNEEQFK
jgi:hypothetical protein